MPPLCANGPCHAHFGPALGGKHREDQHDQEDADADREETEDDEERDEDVPDQFGDLDLILLEGDHAEVLVFEHRRQRRDNRVRPGETGVLVARVGDRDARHHALLTANLLKATQLHQHPGQRRAAGEDIGRQRAAEDGFGQDSPDRDLIGIIAEEEHEPVADGRVEIVGGSLVDVDAVGAKTGDVDRLAIDRRGTADLRQSTPG